jgi:hypothetical protein
MAGRAIGRARGIAVLLVGLLAAGNAVRLHGTPAIISGVAGGVLLVLGIVILASQKEPSV